MTGIYSAIFGTAFSAYYGHSVLRYVLATFTGLAVLNIFSNTTSQGFLAWSTTEAFSTRFGLPVTRLSALDRRIEYVSICGWDVPVLLLIAAFGSRSLLNVLWSLSRLCRYCS